MSLSRRRFISITAGCLLSAGRAAHATDMGARWQGVALGAQADLRIVGMTRERAKQLLGVARAEIERLEKQFSLYRQDSALVSLNSTGILHDPSPDMLQLLGLVSAVHDASNGIFDPTIQPLWEAYAENTGAPSRDAVSSALGKVGWHKVEVTPAFIRLPHGGALTLNGIAQGFITDKVVTLLKAHGLERALINVGEISAVGKPAALDAWPVQFDAAGGLPKTIELTDRAVASSGALGTTLDGSGTVSHILDPRNGRPAPALWRRVSIMHRSAALADGLSTAGVLMDADALAALVRRFDDVSADAVSRDGLALML